MSDILLITEKILLSTYEYKGFLTEDEVIDICIDNDLDLFQIDAMCERLIDKKLIIREEIARTQDDDIVDRSQFDYEALYRIIHREYPKCDVLVNEIKNIMPPQTREWNNLIGQAQSGNEFAKERLVSMYLRTVLKQSYEFSKTYYCDFEEAFQYGVIGLITAIEKYDITSPDTFVSYFPLWVRQSMQRYCEIRGTMYRFPAHYKDKLYKITSELTAYLEDDNVENAIVCLAPEFVSSNDVDEVECCHVMPYIELYEGIEDTTDYTLSVEYLEMQRAVDNILNILNDRERGVIERRFGLNRYNEMTLEEVGSIFNVTRERIRQIEAKALKKLSNPTRIKKLKGIY